MYTKISPERPRQGDIFEALSSQSIDEDGNTQELFFPYWVVLSQECDLEQDHTARNLERPKQGARILSILMTPAFIAENVRQGTYLENLKRTLPSLGKVEKTTYQDVIKNNNPRYHYLKSGEYTPDLIIDFKLFFTMPRHYVYNNLNSRVTSIEDMHKDLISQRYANYISRIGLPETISECEECE